MRRLECALGELLQQPVRMEKQRPIVLAERDRLLKLAMLAKIAIPFLDCALRSTRISRSTHRKEALAQSYVQLLPITWQCS
jgi:hypothetical protein